MFSVKEIFPTIQGEGSKTGHPSVFVRFAGCNLWSGREEDRFKNQKGHCSNWCDTDFYKGTKISANDLYLKLEELTKGWAIKMVVFTGGEPCLQLKKKEAESLVALLLKEDWIVSVETNGTISPEDCSVLDVLFMHKNGHITVSPKPLHKTKNFDQVFQINWDESTLPSNLSHLKLLYGTDLKIIVPTFFEPSFMLFKHVLDFKHYYLQPMDLSALVQTPPHLKRVNILNETLELAKKYGYAISIQTHKLVGLP